MPLFKGGARMEVRKFLGKSLMLAILLLFVVIACYAQQVMRISHVGGYIFPNTDSNMVYAMQGDTLALYDYTVTNRLINILYGCLAPDGSIQPLQSIYTVEVPAEWGYVGEVPHFFQFKNGKLYSAFASGSKLMVFFSTPENTEVHLFDKSGIQYVDSIHIFNESSGYISTSQYSSYQTWVYRLDFESHTLPLFYQNQSSQADTFRFYPIFDEYLLIYTHSAGVPDILVRNGEIIDTFPDNWGGPTTIGYYGYQNLCGTHFFFQEESGINASRSVIGWVENNTLHRSTFDIGVEQWGPAYLFQCEQQSDSTFTCRYIDSSSNANSFKNYRISNHELIEDDFFPNLSSFQNPMGQFRMGDDYLVAVTRGTGDNYNLFLADYQQQCFRSYEVAISGSMYGLFFHSNTMFYWLGPNGNVHIFRLEMALDAADDLLPSISLTLRAYPNPFRSSVSVRVASDRQTEANLGVYNLRGQLVRSLHQGALKQGEAAFSWDGRDAKGKEVPNGLYLVCLDAGGQKHTAKLVHLK